MGRKIEGPDNWTSIRMYLNRETDKDIIDFYYQRIQPSARSAFIKEAIRYYIENGYPGGIRPEMKPGTTSQIDASIPPTKGKSKAGPDLKGALFTDLHEETTGTD